jgi:hypothetical protein
MKQMKRIIIAVAGLALATTLTLAKDLINADTASRTGLQGYDPVAFFTEAKPAKGDPAITAKFEDVTYFFTSEKHKAAFMKSPQKYLPAYGGYCAYGVSVNRLFPVEIDTWEIVDGRLILQFDQATKRKFAKNKMANFAKADGYWPGLVESKGQ